MRRKHAVPRHSWLALVVLLLVVISTGGCDIFFHLQELRSMCQLIDQAQIREPTDGVEQVVFETPGTIVVLHGFRCALSSEEGREDVIKLNQTVSLPDYVQNATVFLNGWRFKYHDDDHHVAGLGTFIRNIELSRNILTWEAIGAFGDHNFDDTYSWCYQFTVVGWNPSTLDLLVDHEDQSCEPDSSVDVADANFHISDNATATTALAAFPSFLRNPGFVQGVTVAILPRGFGFNVMGNDRHLLQIGSNLDHSESFVEGGKTYRKGLEGLIPLPATAAGVTNQVDSGFATWETYAVFKDNDARKDYRFGEVVSGLAGRDVGVIQPPFSILPLEDAGVFGATLTTHQGIAAGEFIVENIPFEFAIPMLTGWELASADDEHVTELGASIEGFEYERPPGASSGTLRYTLSTILRDKDSDSPFRSRHKVTVLGLRPLSPVVVPSVRGPDLTPHSPLGTSLSAFCRFEEQRKLLRVTVRNVGDGDAGPSQTTVMFRTASVTLKTPPLPAAGSVDLLFKVPGDCFSPDCAFRIAVDSGHQVDEPNGEQNNSAAGHCEG